MSNSTRYEPQDLFKVAKFIARISGTRKIGHPQFLIALEFFKPLKGDDDASRRIAPKDLQAATPVILNAYDGNPRLPLSEEMRQMRNDMDLTGTQFEVIDEAIHPTETSTAFIRMLVRSMEIAGKNEWDITLETMLTAWGKESGASERDRVWAKTFSESLFTYLRGNPYHLYDSAADPTPSAGLTPSTKAATTTKPCPATLRATLRTPYTQALSEQVLGQPLALRWFDESLLLSAWMPSRRAHPEVFLLAGPSATGKSTFVDALRQEWALRGGEHITIDMASMLSYNEGFGLTGLRAGYDSAGPGRLTSYVQEHPDALVILENVTQAHPNVQALLIPLLTSGKLADEYGFGPGADRGHPDSRDVSFANATVILTCTVGEEVFELPANLKRYDSDPDALVALLKDAMGNIASDGVRSRNRARGIPSSPAPLRPTSGKSTCSPSDRWVWQRWSNSPWPAWRM